MSEHLELELGGLACRVNELEHRILQPWRERDVHADVRSHLASTQRIAELEAELKQVRADCLEAVGTLQKALSCALGYIEQLADAVGELEGKRNGDA